MATALNKNLVEDTSKFINLYLNPQLQSKIQEIVRKNPKTTFRGRPIHIYMRVALSAMHHNDRTVTKNLYHGSKTDSESIITFFEKFETDQGFRNRTLKGLTTPQGINELHKNLTPIEVLTVNAIEEKSKGDRKQLREAYSKAEAFKPEIKTEEGAVKEVKPEQAVSTEPAVQETPLPTPIIPSGAPEKTGPFTQAPQVIARANTIVSKAVNSSIVKNLISRFQITARRFVAKHPELVASGVGAIIGGAAGYGVAGRGGAMLGMFGGGIAPQIVKGGGLGRVFGGMFSAGKIASTGGKLAKLGFGVSNPVGWAMLAADSKIGKKVIKRTFNQAKMIAIIVGAIIFAIPLMGFVSNLEKSTALLPPYDVDTNVEPTGTPPPSPTGVPIPGLELTKTGPNAVNNGENIKFTITAKYSGSGDIEIKDQINSSDGEILVDTITGTTKSANSNTIIWGLKGNSPNENGEYIFEFVTKPLRSNFYFKNKAVATDLTSYNNSDIAKILPDTEQTDLTIQKQKAVADLLRRPNIIQNISIYQEASRQTGVAWEILAGIHYREGGMGPSSSLASGRPIGQVEPDVRDCEEEYQPGRPYRVGNGCVFKNLLDTAIYAGDHFKGKNDGSAPSTLEELVGALSRYNGGGNANCGKLPTPYTGCPRLYSGEDDPYAVNLLDKKHEKMYVIYCTDYIDPINNGICPGGYRPDPNNVGVLSAIMGIVKYFNQN